MQPSTHSTETACHYLGISAKSAASPKNNKLGQPFDDDAKVEADKRKWKLQRAAQSLLRGERIVHCQRSLNGNFVSIYRNTGGTKARYQGLQTCGSVWHCPICAAKITEGRRRDMQQAITNWTNQGGAVYLMTLTYPHEITLGLEESVKKQAEAMRKMKAARAYKELMKEAGAIGSIRALEVTYGEEHGWHPHTHDLIFAAPGMMQKLEHIRGLWAKAVLKADLGTINEHGFDLQDGTYAAEYVAKFGMEPKTEYGGRWGTSSEMVKGHTKLNRRLSGATPFTLLSWFCENNDREAAELFQQYGIVFAGKRQLYYSPKLKEKLNLVERTDEELADSDIDKCDDPVCQIDSNQWGMVLSRNKRYELLFMAAKHGEEGVKAYLEELAEMPTTHQPYFATNRGFNLHRRH